MEIDHEVFSTVILSLPLFQEGQLSVSDEKMCTILVNSLEDKACSVKVWLGKLTLLDMTIDDTKWPAKVDVSLIPNSISPHDLIGLTGP